MDHANGWSEFAIPAGIGLAALFLRDQQVMNEPAPRTCQEVQLLLASARTFPAAEQTAHVPALCSGDLDWPYLLQLAEGHGIMPLLYKHLSSLSPNTVPHTELGQLQHQYRRNAVHNLFLVGELFHLLELFEAHAIHAVPYKGPTLAIRAYGNLSMRQFGDLDLLLREQETSRKQVSYSPAKGTGWHSP